MPFSIFQQSFLWFFFIFCTFEKPLEILPLWVLSWFFMWYCLGTQRTILPIFKSFGVHLRILVVIPYVMPLPLELMYFGAWLGEAQVKYDHLTLRLKGSSTEDVGILEINLCMLIILWLFILLTLLILCILCILSILFIVIVLIFILIIWLNDGAWWRHKAPSAAEMMEEAWKSGRQVCRLFFFVHSRASPNCP